MRAPPRQTLPRRRLLLGAGAALALPMVYTPGRAQAPRPPTPSQTEGPFYPLELPDDHDADLLVQGPRRYAHGETAWLEGTLTDTLGRPLHGAVVEIWQCDHAGRYHHPRDGGRADPDFQGFGRMQVGVDGSYRFRTIKPMPYAGRTPHIHLKVKQGDRELLTTQIYVAGEPRNARDGLWRGLSPTEREALTVPFTPAADGLRARMPLVVAV